MRHEFQGYYRPTEGELEVLWRHCMFILDANVLLNLYRYPQQARADFLSLLRQIQDRIWVPHQAALEYQENRLKVIAEQVKRFSDVRKVLGDARNRLRGDLDNLQLSKRHSSIDPDRLLSNEIRAKAGVDGFYMYNPERFLEYAKTKLGAQVKEESIEQVRDIAALNRRQTSVESIRHLGLLAERAALYWLRSSHENETVIQNERGFPDFIVINEATGRKVGYEVKALREPLWAHRLVQDVQYRAFFEVSEGRLSEFFLILIGDSLPTAERMIPRLERIAQERPRGVRYIVATMSSETEEGDAPILNPLTVI